MEDAKKRESIRSMMNRTKKKIQHLEFAHIDLTMLSIEYRQKHLTKHHVDIGFKQALAMAMLGGVTSTSSTIVEFQSTKEFQYIYTSTTNFFHRHLPRSQFTNEPINASPIANVSKRKRTNNTELTMKSSNVKRVCYEQQDKLIQSSTTRNIKRVIKGYDGTHTIEHEAITTYANERSITKRNIMEELTSNSINIISMEKEKLEEYITMPNGIVKKTSKAYQQHANQLIADIHKFKQIYLLQHGYQFNDARSIVNMEELLYEHTSAAVLFSFEEILQQEIGLSIGDLEVLLFNKLVYSINKGDSLEHHLDMEMRSKKFPKLFDANTFTFLFDFGALDGCIGINKATLQYNTATHANHHTLFLRVGAGCDEKGYQQHKLIPSPDRVLLKGVRDNNCLELLHAQCGVHTNKRIETIENNLLLMTSTDNTSMTIPIQDENESEYGFRHRYAAMLTRKKKIDDVFQSDLRFMEFTSMCDNDIGISLNIDNLQDITRTYNKHIKMLK